MNLQALIQICNARLRAAHQLLHKRYLCIELLLNTESEIPHFRAGLGATSWIRVLALIWEFVSVIWSQHTHSNKIPPSTPGTQTSPKAQAQRSRRVRSPEGRSGAELRSAAIPETCGHGKACFLPRRECAPPADQKFIQIHRGGSRHSLPPGPPPSPARNSSKKRKTAMLLP